MRYDPEANSCVLGCEAKSEGTFGSKISEHRLAYVSASELTLSSNAHEGWYNVLICEGFRLY